MVEKELGSHGNVYLIDASIYIFRYYFSMENHWWSQEGFPTAAVYGYARWLMRFIQTQTPKYCAACFDESLTTCFRNTLYPDYKQSRALPDEALAFQLNACRKVTELLGIPTYASSSHEADDLLGTLASRARQKNLAVTLITRDKDLSQLVKTSSDVLWDYPDGSPVGTDGVRQKFGVLPHQVADFLALVGDPGDDIPGVPGLGPKTAAALLQRYENWPAVCADLGGVSQLTIRGAKSLAEKLSLYREQIDLALKLTTIVENAPLGRRFSLAFKSADTQKLKAFADTMGFGERFHTSIDKHVIS